MFSVIIPAYNAERFIARTLRSVQGQVWPNFEVFVVDDGSTDRTVEIVERFAASDPRIVLVRTSHSGLPAVARNRALTLSRGEYVAFLDADDLWHEHKLVRFASIIRKSQPAVLFSNGCLIDEEDRPFATMLACRQRQFRRADPILLATNLLPMSSVAVRRDVLPASGFCEDPNLRDVTDYELWLRLNAEYPFVYVPDRLLGYRMHPKQMTARRYQDAQARCAALLRSRRDLLDVRYGAHSVDLALTLIECRTRVLTNPVQAIRAAMTLLMLCDRERRHLLIDYIRSGFLPRSRAAVRQHLRFMARPFPTQQAQMGW